MAFCKNCGAPVESNSTSSGEQVVGIKTYLGYMLLSAIPIAGLIIGILTACGSMWNGNKNMSNLAKAQFILVGIVLGIYILFFIFAFAIGIFAGISSSL